MPLFNQCSKVQFEELNENPLSIVKSLCSQQNTASKTFEIFFDDPETTCNWEVDGNLNPLNGYFQARIEQFNKISLPENSVLCDLEFEFQEQNMKYDDHFLFSLNAVVLASSYDFSSKLMQNNNMLYYDWANIAGMYWDKSKEVYKDESYCLGKESNNASCYWPITDTNGQINLDYSPDVIQQITALDLKQNEFNFQFTTIGDNDNLDCEHSPISFTLRATFVEP